MKNKYLTNGIKIQVMACLVMVALYLVSKLLIK